MALSKPRAQFAHRRTVRLLVDTDVSDIDALKIAQSLSAYADDIQGIVPLFGGKCFDITLASPEAAAKLAQEGIDYEQVHKPLRLLGQRSIHVSVFVSVEYPDADLLNLLATYGQLKSKSVRHLRFSEQGFTHIENGVRVVEFTRIERDIPKRLVIAGLEIGFKYSGQPVTCHRCHSTEHVVKNCPKRRRHIVGGGDENNPPPPANNADPPAGQVEDRGDEPEEGMDVHTTPELFSPPSASATYAQAATGTSSDEPTEPTNSQGTTTTQTNWDFLAPRATKGGRKRDPPPRTSSDDEESTPKKHINAEPTDSPIAEPANTTVASGSPPSQSSTAPPAPSGLKKFITALAQGGNARNILMKTVPAVIFYRCQAYYLFHKYGEFTEQLGKKHKASPACAEHWASLKGTVPQDAFAQLLEAFKDIQKRYELFITD